MSLLIKQFSFDIRSLNYTMFLCTYNTERKNTYRNVGKEVNCLKGKAYYKPQ